MNSRKNSEDLEADLKELEELANMDEEKDLENEIIDDCDLDDLEKQINEMENDGSFEEEKPKAKTTKIPIQELENEFHRVEYMFGNVLEDEINTILPNLRKKYSGDTFLDYHILLNKKEQELIKLKSVIGQKVGDGSIDENKYLELLHKVVSRNREALNKASAEKLDDENIKRMNERINGLQFEIDEVTEAIRSPQNNHEDECNSSHINMKNKVEEPKVEKKDEKAKDDNETVPENINTDMNDKNKILCEKNDKENKEDKIVIDKEEQQKLLIHFAKKFSVFLKIHDYMQKVLTQEKAESIKILENKIKDMREKLDEMKKGGSKDTIEELDKLYPDFEPEFLIGCTKKERNEEIDKIFADVKKDLVGVKDNQLAQLYNKHYIEILRQLKDVKESTYGLMPKLHKKTVTIPYPDTNPGVPKGVLDVVINKIHPIKQGTYYYLIYEFVYEDETHTDTTKYCSYECGFEYKKRFDLDRGKLSRSFSRTAITFSLYKRKLLITSRLISNYTLPLSKLANLCTMKFNLEFNYRDEHKLIVEGAIMINTGLSKPMKEIDLYAIDKMYPIFNLTDSSGGPAPVHNTSTTHAKIPNNQRTNMEEENVDSLKKADHKIKSPHAEFKYPVLTAKQKTDLAAIVSKLKLPASYVDFQDKVLNVTYLEEFKNEIEKQIDKFARNEDFDSMKEAQNLMMNATRFYNFLIDKLQSGEMSPGEYKQKVDAFILMDEKSLAFFKSVKYDNAVILISNRLDVMRTEKKQLEQQLLEAEE